MCISFAVMLPVGNPPNAIVFSYGHCQIKDMVSGALCVAGGQEEEETLSGMRIFTAFVQLFYFVAFYPLLNVQGIWW